MEGAETKVLADDQEVANYMIDLGDLLETVREGNNLAVYTASSPELKLKSNSPVPRSRRRRKYKYLLFYIHTDIHTMYGAQRLRIPHFCR